MPSANDFIKQALVLIGVIDPTEDVSAEDAEVGLDVLNDWIDALGTQRLTMYVVTRTTKTLTSGTASYTIGSGGDINIVRPQWIENAGLILDTTATTPTEVAIQVLSDDAYAQTAMKTLTSSLTSAIWYDHNWSAGLGRVYVFPIPTVSTTQLVLYAPTALTEFANLSNDYTFPPGYRRAIRYNLALELVSHYPTATPPPDLIRKASDALGDIKRANYRSSTVVIDPTVQARRGTLSRARFLSGNV